MIETLLHVGDPARGLHWQSALPALVPDLAVRQWPDLGDPAAIRYVAAWNPPVDLFATLPNLQVVFSVAAGIDHLDLATIPAAIPLVRMTEPGLLRGMVEYAALATLSLHRDLPGHIDRQRRGEPGDDTAVPTARRRIGVLGLGRIGGSVATRLAGLGFPVAGWSRSPRHLDGVEGHAGWNALPGFLARTDILLCVLPLTPETENILDARLFAMLPSGASIVNIGRGAHLDENALLAALDDGHLTAAILDVTRQEPLPADHPFRADPRIVVTPHIAGKTDAAGGAAAIAGNIRRHRRGEPMIGIVDRRAGY